MLKNTKSNRSGFTLVELLIVIVVIAILAVISIVAYNGVTTKANNSAAKANAESVQKVAEAINADADSTGYPVDAAALQTGNSTVKLPSGVSVASNNPTSSNGKTTIGYKANASSNPTGACISYWDFEAKTIKFVYAGSATTGGPTTAGTAMTCS